MSFVVKMFLFRWAYLVTLLVSVRCTRLDPVVQYGNDTSLNVTSDSRYNPLNLDDYIRFAINDLRYGNYCGRFKGKGTPINDLDECCEDHDSCHKGNCYENSSNCRCNKKFRSCVGKAKKSCRWWESLSSYCSNARAIYDYANDARRGACYGRVSYAFFYGACGGEWGKGT